MRILTLHGFMAKADNKNYNALCEIMPAENIIAPQLYYKEQSPAEILEMLSALAEPEDIFFVGQSLGGWFADKLSRKLGRPCILTNPCCYPHELELITNSGMPASFVEQYREMSAHDKNELAYTLCGDEDTLLPDNYDNSVKLSRSVTIVHGGHSTIEDLSGHLKASLEKIGIEV